MPGDSSAISSMVNFGRTYVDEKTGRSKTSVLIGGYDLETQIEEMSKARRKQADFYQKEIDSIDNKKLPELIVLKQKTTTLQQIAAQLTNFTPLSGSTPPANVFQQKAVIIQPNSDNSVGLLVTNDAVSSPNSLVFSVQQLAKNDSIGTAASSTFSPTISSPNVDPTVALNLTGNLVINGQTVSITSTMALNDINTAIQSVAAAANITTSINGGTIAGSSSYLVLTSTLSTPGISLTGTSSSILTGLGLKTDQADPTIPLGMTGNLVINGQTVAVTPTMSLTDIYNGINAIGTTAKVSAQLLNLSSTSGYKLFITANQTAVPIDFTGTSSSLQGSNGLSLPATNTALSTLQAQFTYNGNAIVRNTNSVTDLISGITINLQSISPTSPTQGQTTAIIGNDVTTILSTIQSLVAAYNDLVQEINKNQCAKINPNTGTVEPDKDAVLYGDSILTDLKQILTNFAGGIVQGLNASLNYTTLAQAGINLSETNVLDSVSISGLLEIDQTVLSTAINNNLAMVTQLFGDSVTISSNYFEVFNFPSSLSPFVGGQPITVSYQKNLDSTYSATLSVPGQTPVTIPSLSSTKLIVGPAGSIFDGLTIGYTGPDPTAGGAPVTTTVTLTQGLADVLNTNLSDALQTRTSLDDPPIGLFDYTLDAFMNKEDALKQKIERINKAADTFVKNFESRIGDVYKAADRARNIINIFDTYKKLMENNKR